MNLLELTQKFTNPIKSSRVLYNKFFATKSFNDFLLFEAFIKNA